jgi:hypothetical protein
MLHAGALDPGGELRANLLGQLWRDVTTQEAGDLLDFHGQHGLADELVIERRKRCGGPERQVGGVFHLHQAPVVGLPEHVRHRAAPGSIMIEDTVKLLG